jgi:hypothetical protein
MQQRSEGAVAFRSVLRAVRHGMTLTPTSDQGRRVCAVVRCEHAVTATASLPAESLLRSEHATGSRRSGGGGGVARDARRRWVMAGRTQLGT